MTEHRDMHSAINWQESSRAHSRAIFSRRVTWKSSKMHGLAETLGLERLGALRTKRNCEEFDRVAAKLNSKLGAATPTAMAATGERIEEGVAELQEKVRQQGVELAQQSTMIGYPNMGTRVHQQGHPGKRHG